MATSSQSALKPLKFAGKEIPGTTLSVVPDSPELRVRRVAYWDVAGEGEIVGAVGGRTFMVTHILHKRFSKLADFQKAVGNLESLIGEHGKLEEGGLLSRTFDDLTLDSVTPIPLDGQEFSSPLQDVGVLTAPGSAVIDGGWFQLFALKFRQLIT